MDANLKALLRMLVQLLSAWLQGLLVDKPGK